MIRQTQRQHQARVNSTGMLEVAQRLTVRKAKMVRLLGEMASGGEYSHSLYLTPGALTPLRRPASQRPSPLTGRGVVPTPPPSMGRAFGSTAEPKG